MTNQNMKDVPKTVHNLSLETQVRMEVGCKYFNMSMKAFVTRLVDKFWLDYGEKITAEMPQQTYNKQYNKICDRFYDSKRYIE